MPLVCFLQSVYSDDSSDFEDEDIYEDVVQSNDDNLSRELDFINQNFNVTRSLWCEIPEVKKSAVLSKCIYLILFKSNINEYLLYNFIFEIVLNIFRSTKTASFVFSNLIF